MGGSEETSWERTLLMLKRRAHVLMGDLVALEIVCWGFAF